MSVINLRDSDPRVLTLQKALAEIIEQKRFDDLSIAQVIGVLELLKLHLWDLVPMEKP